MTMFGARSSSVEDERFQSLYDHRDWLPLARRASVEHDHAARRPTRFLVGLAFFVLLIGAEVADGLGWAEVIADRGRWSDLAMIVLALPAAYALYDGRRGVGLGPTVALTLAVGLLAVLVAVIVVL